jgi:IS30 family transposase
MNLQQFRHLNQYDRDRIEALLAGGETQEMIAKILKVNESTISREVRRRQRINGRYDATCAQQKAYVKRHNSKYQGMKVESDSALKAYIIERLKEHRSPDEIAGRMKREKQPFHASKDAIYHWLYSTWGQAYCRHLCSKRYRIRRQKKNKTKRVMIPDRIGIRERPLGATNKTRYKHFEADTAVAPRRAHNTHAIAVAAERKSKFVLGTKIPSMSPVEMTQAMQMFGQQVYMRSATTDNGIENKGHRHWGVPTFFADSHSPWQKPLIENTIGLLRRWFFKKGTDWSTVSEQQLQYALSFLNNKYRKSLGYASALEVATAHDIIKSDSNQKSCI